MSNDGAAPRAAVPATGAPTRAAPPVSNARSEASRKNGAKWRGPKTAEGKARSAQNALRHGMRATKHVVLPQEDAAAFAALETAILAELAPDGALQTLLARRIAVAAWRLTRADRMEAEVLEFRSYDGANPGLALIRDGNATRAFETLLRYRSTAIAEFTRALRALKALQAEQAANAGMGCASRPAAQVSRRVEPNEPCLADLWHEVGRPPRARGGRAGSEIGTNPGTVSPVLSMIPPRILLSPNGWSAQARRQGGDRGWHA